MDDLYLGVDIGGTEVKIGLVTGSGDILKADNFSVNFDNYKTFIIKTVLKSIDMFINKNNLDISTILGIGVSATGQIDTCTGSVVGTSGHIDNWIGTPLKDILKDKYRIPVSVANDANCAIIGEYWKGSAISFSNIIMITVGTGIGGGIIADGKLLSGKIGIAGELGHFPINTSGKKCSCGNIGCYEQYASTTALVTDVRELLTSDTNIYIENINDINGKFIFEQIRLGNNEIKNIVDKWIENIAIGLVGLIHIFNPELVIIGGGVSSQEDLFITPLRNKVFEMIMPSFKMHLKISSASLGNYAGLCGAVYNLIYNQ
ncbi:ROK family protein [Clostridium sp. AL.422]|uniref:ROK family protein n=1 Tax=Clostridium TaxID=1485 RepID=UPI00293DE49A|nr:MULTISPECIES: ROK family protein [unclassified Clostridium]MDV4152105.1 ROK family protein [Clostridium sp. AL.422]